MEEVIKRANDTQYGLAAGWTVLIINTENINLSFYTIYSYLFGSIVVNLSCKNSHYYTVQEEQFNIVRFLVFKNAYSLHMSC